MRLGLVSDAMEEEVTLSARERAILVLRLTAQDPASLDDLAAMFTKAAQRRVTRERVRQIETKLMSKLRWNLAKEFDLPDDERSATRELPG